MKKFFEGKTCVAEYNDEQEFMLFSFNGYPVIEEHKKMYMEAMEYLKKNRTIAFIMDFRGIKGTFTMLNDWVIEFFRPAVQLGLKKSAMVLNEDIFTAFASNDAIGKVKLVQIQVFKTMEEAEQWAVK